VLMNLCVNARDAMPEGGELRISLENVTLTELDCVGIQGARRGNFVCATVADTGKGIPPELVARIFDLFFTTKQEGSGTGMGLATVQTVLKAHEGFAAVDSKPGSGTTFKVYIPAITAPAPAGNGDVKSPEVPRGQGELVLVVEDNKAMLEATVRTLEEFGYRTLQATNGIEAIKCYSEHSSEIRLVVTDAEMPRFNGRLLARTLRRIAPELPTLMVTAVPGKRGLTRDADATGFLAKPFTADTLLHSIRQLIEAAHR